MVFDPQTQWHSSTKIDAFLTQLDTIWKCFRDDAMAAQEKFGNILVFSQWVAMLDLIGVRDWESRHADRIREARIQV